LPAFLKQPLAESYPAEAGDFNPKFGRIKREKLAMTRLLLHKIITLRNFSYLFIVAMILIISRISYTDESFNAFFCCQWTNVYESRQRVHTKLLDCSNVQQKIVQVDDSLQLQKADVDGWNVYSVKNGSKFGSIAIDILKDRDQLIYFPRLPSGHSRVVVYDITNGARKVVETITNESAAWMPIGLQSHLCTQCFRYSGILYDVNLQIEIQLIGTNAQLWVKDGRAFF